MTNTTTITRRTSTSHPLQIAALASRPGRGRIGITFCPGKKQPAAATGSWDRDLALDLDAIARWGASAVVTLVEPHELAELGVADLGTQVVRRQMGWFHLPIADFNVPDVRFEAAWEKHGPSLRRLLVLGFDIVVHCKGGLGRAGMIAARLLVELGEGPEAAIAAVRHVRPGAIETREQERHVANCSSFAAPAPAPMQPDRQARALGALFGLAAGDAVGTTLEFTRRDSYELLTDMVGGGPFKLEPGQWTDDTAMALALADSLIAKRGLAEDDLMQRFGSWRDEGAYSCTGTCFDIGVTTSEAISRWRKTGDPLAGLSDPRSAGNGSLMRLAPVVLAYASDRAALREVAARQSRTTHAALAAVDACILYAELLADIIEGKSLEEALAGLEGHARQLGSAEIVAIARGSWKGKRRDQIHSSGYVVHSLEAAIWCAARSFSFEEAVLLAANLGDDADTTAAIAGQLAGALYGLPGIPERWRKKLAWQERLVATGEQLLAVADAPRG